MYELLLERCCGFLHPVKNFGIVSRGDLYKKYISQGSWTRCVECQKKASLKLGTSESPSVQSDKRNKDNGGGRTDCCGLCVNTFGWDSIRVGMHGCRACSRPFGGECWNKEILRNHERFKRPLVCNDCNAKGCTAKDRKTYVCTQCLKDWGSLKFNKHDLYYSKRSEGKGTLRCTNCKSKIKCDACKIPYPKTYWPPKERYNNQQTDAHLVCKECRDRGCTATDVTLYECQVCKEKLGMKRFGVDALKHFKYHGRTKLQCNTCVAAVARRVQELQAELRKSKRICRCFCLLHKERCPLSPSYAGEKRWPGSDGFISAADRQFLDGLRPWPKWWSKGWGRKS